MPGWEWLLQGALVQHAVAQAKQVGREAEQVDAAGSDGCMYFGPGSAQLSSAQRMEGPHFSRMSMLQCRLGCIGRLAAC